MRLDDSYINFIIISAYRGEDDNLENRLRHSKLHDTLIHRDFNVMEMSGNQPCYIAYKECDNNDLRYDAIELMDQYKQQYVIVKYKGEVESKKITYEGKELLLGLVEYSGEQESNENFFVEGRAFSFEPRKRYWTPKKVGDIKEGMVVELKDNSGNWVEKVVKDPEVEYERMYKLMSRYNKLRIPYVNN